MATRNAADQEFVNESDGFSIAGGSTKRELSLSSGDVSFVGGGSYTHTFPAATTALLGASDVSADSAYVFTDESTTSTSYTGLTTPIATTVNVGPAGILIVAWSLGAYNASAVMKSSVALSGANTVASNDEWSTDSRSATYLYGQSCFKVFTGLNPGSTTVTMQFKTSSGTANFFNKLLNAIGL